MAAFSSNVWYQMSETRVGLSSALQYFGGQTVGFFSMNASNPKVMWQILPHSTDVVSFRVQDPGPFEQLGVCYVPAEVDPSHTQPCLEDTNQDDPAQQWQISAWGDGTWKITNLLNGTGYNLDVHPGNPVFLSSDTAPEPIQVGQHWIISSIGLIDDSYWSTTSASAPQSTALPPSSQSSSPQSSSQPASPHSTSAQVSSQPTSLQSTSQPTPSALQGSATRKPPHKISTTSHTPIATAADGRTATISTTPFRISGSTSSSIPTSASTSSGLSTGASVGIGVGVALGVLLLAALGVFFFLARRRRQQASGQQHLAGSDSMLGTSSAAFNNYPYAPVQIDGREKRAWAEADPAAAKPPLYEAPVTEPLGELDGGYRGPHEYDGQK